MEIIKSNCYSELQNTSLPRKVENRVGLSGPILFKFFINYLNEGIEVELIKSVDNAKTGRIANALYDRFKVQKGLDRLEH